MELWNVADMCYLCRNLLATKSVTKFRLSLQSGLSRYGTYSKSGLRILSSSKKTGLTAQGFCRQARITPLTQP